MLNKFIFALTIISTLSFGLVFEAKAVYEPESLSVFIDQNTIEKGYTIENSNKHFRLGFGPGVLSSPVRVVFKDFDQTLFNFPEGMEAASGVYEFDILDKTVFNDEKPLMLEIIGDQAENHLKDLYFFNGVKQTWELLPSRTIDEQSVKALIHLPYARLVVLKDIDSLEIGQASWYGYKGCDCAASPDYPKGSVLKVTNLDTQESLEVIVNDYGPDRSIFPQRIIDLDKVAFKALGLLSDGILKRILVEKIK